MCLLFSAMQTKAQFDTVNIHSYKLLKFDVLNAIGLSVQKLHFGYEFSPLKANVNTIPTVQVDLEVPISSLREDMQINMGVEGGAMLRFYPQLGFKDEAAQGYYYGFGIQGGWVSYSKDVIYFLTVNRNVQQSVEHQFNRYRTSLFAVLGAQSNLGSNLYFDFNLGLGWSNVNVNVDQAEVSTDYSTTFDRFDNVLLLQFNEGKNQRLFMPISMSIGYNFGRN